MKAIISILIISIFTSFFFLTGFNFNSSTRNNNSVFINDKDINGRYNPDISKWYFNIWYQPYGEVSPEMRLKMTKDIELLPIDNDAVNNWVLMGPIGFNLWGGTEKYSGRVTDLEVDGVPSIRVGAASGGVWGYVLIFPVPLSDNITSSINIGSFDSKPGDANTILVGTGEFGTGLWGSGLFKTTNGGTNYVSTNISPIPPAFFKLRYSVSNPDIVHAATYSGYYRSTNGGDSWTRIQFTTNVTDLGIDPSNNNIIYAPVWNDGLYKSTNAGLNWTKLTAGGIPTSNFGRTSVSVSASNSNIVYANVARNDNNQTLGVYKSTNAGSTWTNITPPSEFHWGQGWYNTLCGVSPTDPNRIFVGGGAIYRSTNGGSSWTEVSMHPDQHAIAWNNAGTSCWIGNDGGVYNSQDGGLTFTSNGNLLPITQYVIFDVHPAGNYCYGGSQDNGISGTTNRGTTWFNYLGGDGGGMAIDPTTPSKIAITNGVYGGSWAFRRLLTTNSGVNWTFIDNGIDPSTQWYHRVRNDKVSPVYLYDNSGQYVYESTNYGTNWVKLNTTAFPCVDILNMSVSRWVSPRAVVYACLNNNPPTANKLRVFDNGTWSERSTGFPSNRLVRKVSPHPTNSNIAYALINGFSAGQKVYKSTNRGVAWTNITGNLPDIPLADLVAHPTNDNLLYLGTEMGSYKTTNGGQDWVRWNNGMPNAVKVSEMGYIDSLAANGKFYIVSATYGRSIYTREISGDDPSSIGNSMSEIPNQFDLSQNYPNPFNPVTTINYSVPVKDNIKILLYDIQGRLIKTLLNEEVSEGTHSVKFNGSDLSSGVYFYKFISTKFTDTKKMSLIK